MIEKWKFYKSLCTIDIVIIVVFNLFASGLAFGGGKIDKYNLICFSISVVISSICTVVDFQNIRLVNKFNSSQGISKLFRKYLLVFYILLCPICCLSGYAFFYSLYSIYREYFSELDIVTILLQLLMLFLFLSYLSKVIFTWVLVKDVKENYKKASSNIDAIGIVSN
jgi:hypothetical protein